LLFFAKTRPLKESLWWALQDDISIMGYDTAGDLWCHSKWPSFWSWLKIFPDFIFNSPQNNYHFSCVRSEISSHFASFGSVYMFLSLKSGKLLAFLLEVAFDLASLVTLLNPTWLPKNYTFKICRFNHLITVELFKPLWCIETPISMYKAK